MPDIEVRDGNIESFFGQDSTWTEELVLPEGVRCIGACAFKNCAGIRRIVFPSTLQRIDCGAFRDCKDLEEISLSDGDELIQVGNYAFARTPGESRIRYAIEEENKVRDGRTPINTVDEALSCLNGRDLPGFGIGLLAGEGGGHRYLQYMLTADAEPGTGTVHYEVRRDDGGLIVAFHDETNIDRVGFASWCEVVERDGLGVICHERSRAGCVSRGVYVVNQITCEGATVATVLNGVRNSLLLLKAARDAHPWP